MSDEPNNAGSELRELYRAVSTERSPERLDDAVRRAADAALAQPPARSRWLPALALAATLVLAVGVAFRGELAVEQELRPAAEPAADDEPAAADPPRAPSQEREESAASGAAALGDGRFREKARREAVSGRAKPAAPAASSDSLAGYRPAPPEERARPDTEVAAAAFMDETATRQTPACDDDERRTPEGWLACMEALAERGDRAALAVERDEFALRHPDITLPPPD